MLVEHLLQVLHQTHGLIDLDQILGKRKFWVANACLLQQATQERAIHFSIAHQNDIRRLVNKLHHELGCLRLGGQYGGCVRPLKSRKNNLLNKVASQVMLEVGDGDIELTSVLTDQSNRYKVGVLKVSEFSVEKDHWHISLGNNMFVGSSMFELQPNSKSGRGRMRRRLTSAVRNPPALRINEFPKGEELWRIDWFGEVAFSNRLLLEKHPSVTVYLSKVTGDSSLFARQSATKEERQLQCRVSVGKLMLLRIGDIWKDQQLFDTPAYEQETFHDLSIDREKTALIKAGLSVDDRGFLLPLSEHPGHRRSTQSYCLRVILPDGRSLVVPCMELIRFYFGSSSDLLNLLFRPGLSRARLYTLRLFNPATKYMRLTLSEYVPPASAETIGRIAGSTIAWHAANLPHASCIAGMAKDRAPYPQGVFPFEGKTDLVVAGKWLSHAGCGQQTFLAYQILSCSHPFPFNVLHHAGGRSKRKVSASGTGNSSPTKSFGSKAKEPDELHLVERDPNAKLTPATRAFNARRQFPDLERKTIFGSKTIEASRPSGPATNYEPIHEEAAGEPGTQERCRAVSLIDAIAEVGDPPIWMADAYRTLRQIPGLAVELLTASDRDGWTVPLPLCVDEDGVIPDYMLVSDGGLGRARRAAAFRVVTAERATVLVFIEAPASTSMAYSSNREDEIELIEALSRAAKEYFESLAPRPVKSEVLRSHLESLIGAQNPPSL